MYKFIAFLFSFFLLGCVKVDRSDLYPKYKTLQVNYWENKQQKHLFLNVKEIAPSQYVVMTEEYTEEAPNFLITEIFDYNAR